MKTLLSSHVPHVALAGYRKGQKSNLYGALESWVSVLLHSAPFWPERKLLFRGSGDLSWEPDGGGRGV